MRDPISREELKDFDFSAAASSETEIKISLRSEARLVILTPLSESDHTRQRAGTVASIDFSGSTKAVESAAAQEGLYGRTAYRNFRHNSTVRLLKARSQVSPVHGPIRHRALMSIMIYAHGLNRGAAGVRSPLMCFDGFLQGIYADPYKFPQSARKPRRKRVSWGQLAASQRLSSQTRYADREIRDKNVIWIHIIYVRRHGQGAATKSALDPKRTFAFCLMQAH